MKVSNSFEEAIKDYLDNRAKEDPLFAKSYSNEKKNIKECLKFILTEVKRMQVAGLADEEVYSLAVHYYDEEKVTIDKSLNAKVVINKKVQISEEEIKEAKKKALDEIIQEEKNKLKSKNVAKTKKDIEEVGQQTLF